MGVFLYILCDILCVNNVVGRACKLVQERDEIDNKITCKRCRSAMGEGGLARGGSSCYF